MAERIEERPFTLGEYCKTCLKRWRWFAGSTLTLTLLTVLYLLVKVPVYERSAQVMIKDNNPGGSIAAGLSAFQSMGFLGGSSSVNNEMAAMLTPAVMLETIDRLKLDYNYTERQLLKSVPLYGKDLPVSISIGGLTNEDKVKLTLELQGGKVTVKDMRKNKESFDEELTTEMGKTVKTPVGQLTISPGPAYRSNEARTIKVVRMQPFEQADKQFKRLVIGMDDELAQVITLSYQDESPERATDILNTLIDVYNEDWMQDKNGLTEATQNFIDSRIAVIEKELTGVEESLSEYKSRNRLPDIVETARVQITKSEELNEKRVELESQMMMAQTMADYLRDEANKNELLPSKLLINDPNTEQQIMELNKLQQQRNRLVASSSEENARVKEMDNDLRSMRRALLASMDNTVKQLRIQVKGLAQSEQKSKDFIQEAPIKGKHLLSAERQQKVQEELYIFLLQKREENVMSQAFTAYNTRILTPPVGHVKPIAPRKLRLLAASMVIGFILPAIAIFVIMNLRRERREAVLS